MEKYLKLYQNLEKCYLNISFHQYLNSPEEVKENTCKAEKEALLEYLHSDAMNNENIVKERINKYKSKIIKFISFL
jgi:hypothetical protein